MDGLLGHIEGTWNTLTAPVPRPTSGEGCAAPPVGNGSKRRCTEQTPKTKTDGRLRAQSTPTNVMHFRGSTPQHRARAATAEGPTFLLGVNVLVVNGLVTVKSFVPHSVCDGKLQADDIIHSLNGRPCRTVDALRSACPGEVGSILRVRYSRPPGAQCMELVLKRAADSCGAGYFCESTSAPDDPPSVQQKDVFSDLRQAAHRHAILKLPATLDASTRMSPEPCSPRRAPQQISPRQSTAMSGRSKSDPASTSIDDKLAVPRGTVECRTSEFCVLPDASTRERDQLVEERIEQLIAAAESIWQTAQRACVEISHQNHRVMQEHCSLGVKMLQSQSVSANSIHYEALLRKNKALENELHALTEDLDDHYVPMTVFEAVRKQLQASVRHNEIVVKECDRLQWEVSKLQNNPSSGRQLSASDTSGEETFASGETTARAGGAADNSESSEFGERRQDVRSDERRRWLKERDDLIAEIERLRQKGGSKPEKVDVKMPQQYQGGMAEDRADGFGLAEIQIATQMCPSSQEQSLSPKSDGQTRQAGQASTSLHFKRTGVTSPCENLIALSKANDDSSPWDCEKASIMNQSSITGLSRSPCFSSPDLHPEQTRSGDAVRVEAATKMCDRAQMFIAQLEAEQQQHDIPGSGAESEMRGLADDTLLCASESTALKDRMSPTTQFSCRKALNDEVELDEGRLANRHSLADLCSNLSLLSAGPAFHSGPCDKLVACEGVCGRVTDDKEPRIKECAREEDDTSRLVVPAYEPTRSAATPPRSKGWFDDVFDPKVWVLCDGCRERMAIGPLKQQSRASCHFACVAISCEHPPCPQISCCIRQEKDHLGICAKHLAKGWPCVRYDACWYFTSIASHPASRPSLLLLLILFPLPFPSCPPTHRRHQGDTTCLARALPSMADMRLMREATREVQPFWQRMCVRETRRVLQGVSTFPAGLIYFCSALCA